MWILMKGERGQERHTPHVVCKCTVIDKMLVEFDFMFYNFIFTSKCYISEMFRS